jgi:hypothetical protein
MDAPIFAAEAVLSRAALGADSAMLQSEEEGGSLLETTGGASADPRLDVFRDFINSLDLDLGGKEGPPARPD